MRKQITYTLLVYYLLATSLSVPCFVSIFLFPFPMFCINTHKRLKKALLCLELYTKVGRATDVHEENNYRKLEIGFLENVLVRFNTQSYIELKTFIKMPPAQKNSPLRSD